MAEAAQGGIVAVWTPQIGPQLDAITADWCDEVFFGGARGGGKSDYLLGDYLQDVPRYAENWQGILFRRTVPELQELIRRSQAIYLQTDAEWKEGAKEWRWPNGAILRMRHLDRVRDAMHYQGHQFCLEVSERVLLANGSSKRIGDIVVGDVVATLEGAQPVTAVMEPRKRLCVRAKTKYGEQIQSLDHSMLSAYGWSSYASTLGIDARESSLTQRELCKLPQQYFVARLAEPAVRLMHRCGAENTNRYPSVYRLPIASDVRYRGLRRLVWLIYWGLMQNSLREQRVQGHSVSKQRYVASCAATYFGSVTDYRVGYRPLRHSGGGRFQAVRESDLENAQQQGGAAERSREHCSVDVRGSTPKHNPAYYDVYPHPYVSEERRALCRSTYEACELTPVGERLTRDIQVDGAGHYITANKGFVNKNCWVGWDELTQWPTLEAYDMLRACLRWAAGDVPKKRIRATGNPGGPGHHAVYQRFIEPAPLGCVPIDDPDTGMTRMFIRSRVEDNRILLARDPQYISRLKGVGSPELVRAWLEGDWSAIAGAYFPEFSDSHILKPFLIPKHWTRFRSFDWGSARPFSCGFWAVSDQTDGKGNAIPIPKGALVRYREWYGCEPTKANTGLKMRVEDVAAGIVARSAGEEYAYSVADPAIFKEDGGPSIAETMRLHGVSFKPADNTRITGWQQLRARLIGEDDKPLIYFFENCRDSIRTLPTLQHDRNKVEDVDTDMEDHAADEIRYAAMSRAMVTEKEEREKARDITSIRWRELIDSHEARMRRR